MSWSVFLDFRDLGVIAMDLESPEIADANVFADNFDRRSVSKSDVARSFVMKDIFTPF